MACCNNRSRQNLGAGRNDNFNLFYLGNATNSFPIFNAGSNDLLIPASSRQSIRGRCCPNGNFCYPRRYNPYLSVSTIGPTRPTGTSAVTSALSAYTATTATVDAGDTPVTFATNGDVIGSDITHTAGSSDFTINTDGTYLVTFSASGTPTADTAFETVSVGLVVNGTAVAGASSSNAFLTLTDQKNFSFSSIISVTGAPTTLSVVISNADVALSDQSITITKLS